MEYKKPNNPAKSVCVWERERERESACSVVSDSATTWTIYSPPGSSIHGILQARILEWVAIFSSRGSSWPRDQTHVSWVSYIVSRFFTEQPGRPVKKRLKVVGREVVGWVRMGIHVHAWLIHVNIWQKPLQYCKVISLQLNKF